MNNTRRGPDGVRQIKLTAQSIRRALREGVEVWAYPMPKNSEAVRIVEVKVERLETGSLVFVFPASADQWFVPRKAETRVSVQA